MMKQGLSDPDPQVAAAAAESLIDSGGSRIHERIRMLLRSSRVAVRKAAAQQLSWYHSPLYWRHKALIDETMKGS